MPETQDYLKKWFDASNADVTFDEWIALRERCKTDLWFLAKEVFGLDLVEYTHRPVTDHFVKKDPCKPLHCQDSCKRRLLLYPRYSFKSTLNIVDCVQWIIAFPEIRIVILTANEELAVGFVGELKNYFTLLDEGDPTYFQNLFPDHCIEEDDGKQDRFTTPARQKYRKEPSACARSIGGSLPGWHYDVMKPDDVVIDKNSETEQLRAKIKRRIAAARKLLVSYGFMDVVGTRWHPVDYYGYLIEKEDELNIKILCKAAWWLKHASINKPKDLLGKEDYELLFEFDAKGVPQLTYEYLAQEKHDDPRSFAYQYLNDVTEAANLNFEAGILRSHTKSVTEFPEHGHIVATLDWASTSNRQSDYSVIPIGLISGPNCYLLDIAFGKWKWDELAYQVIKTVRDWNPISFAIEKSPGYEGLKLEIQRQALQYRVNISCVYWKDVDQHQDAKVNRIRALQPMLLAGRLWFANTIADIDRVYDQFCKFTGETTKKRKDDIPDAIAMLCEEFLSTTELPRQLTPAEKAEREDKEHDAFYKALFPDDAFLEPEPEAPQITDGLNEFLGF